jgi:hypothetical protein
MEGYARKEIPNREAKVNIKLKAKGKRRNNKGSRFFMMIMIKRQKAQGKE